MVYSLARFNKQIHCGFFAPKDSERPLSHEMFAMINKDHGEGTVEWVAPKPEEKKEVTTEPTAEEIALSRSVPGAPDIVTKESGE